MGQIKVEHDVNGIKGLCVVEPQVFGDARGYFVETYNYNDFAANGIDVTFVQDNQSASRRGVLRGLHFQRRHPQAKLLRALRGSVYDVAVDLRRDSPALGRAFGILLGAPVLVLVSLAPKSDAMCFVTVGLAAVYLVALYLLIFKLKKKAPKDEG